MDIARLLSLLFFFLVFIISFSLVFWFSYRVVTSSVLSLPCVHRRRSRRGVVLTLKLVCVCVLMFVECFEKDSRRRSLSGALGTNLNKNNGVSVCKEERKEERKKTIRNRVHFSITIKKQNVDFVMMRSIFLSFFKWLNWFPSNKIRKNFDWIKKKRIDYSNFKIWLDLIQVLVFDQFIVLKLKWKKRAIDRLGSVTLRYTTERQREGT